MTARYPRFGDYRLLHRLAKGGMAEIFLAVDLMAPADDQLVVIKLLREELADDREYIAMFLDEERMIRQLDHPNIVKLRDFGSVRGRYFLALEYVWGESLAALTNHCTVQGKQFPASLAIYIGACVAEALEHAHGQRDSAGRPAPVIHRDVTLGNVVVSHQGAVKILDFGIAKTAGRLTRTRAGRVKGTLSYLAPEQIRSGDASAATDIYQLGVLLYHATVGRPPIAGDNDAHLMRQILNHALVKPSVYNPDYPPILEKVLLKAMKLRPEERFRNIREFRAVLRHFVADAYDDMAPRLAALMAELSGNRHAEQKSFVRALLDEQAALPTHMPEFSWAFDTPADDREAISVVMDSESLATTVHAHVPVAEVIREATLRESASPPPSTSAVVLEAPDGDEQTLRQLAPGPGVDAAQPPFGHDIHEAETLLHKPPPDLEEEPARSAASTGGALEDAPTLIEQATEPPRRSRGRGRGSG